MFTTDACLTGCGGICERFYFHADFPEFISIQHLDINSLEILTNVVALKLWGHLWRGLLLTVRCDNEVAVTALNSGRCRNAFVNSCLREVCFLAATHEFEIRAVHLHGILNREADVLSRRNVTSRTKEQYLQRVQRDQLIVVSEPINFFQLDSPFLRIVLFVFIVDLVALSVLRKDLKYMLRSTYSAGTFSHLRTQFKGCLQNEDRRPKTKDRRPKTEDRKTKT